MVAKMLYDVMYGVYRFLSYSMALVLFILIILLGSLLLIFSSLGDFLLPKDIRDTVNKQLARTICKSTSNPN